jgi:IstB-like ATP binding protein
VGAELLFQVISERAERATLVLTTNLPFSEWTQVLPNARLCKALLDRITDRTHIIETGVTAIALNAPSPPKQNDAEAEETKPKLWKPWKNKKQFFHRPHGFYCATIKKGDKDSN